MNDKQFLGWIHDRLLYVYKENGYMDYMHKLRAIIEATPEGQTTPNVASYKEQKGGPIMEHCVKCGRELTTDYEHLSGICCACMAVDEEYEWEEAHESSS